MKIFKHPLDGREQVLRTAGPGERWNEVPIVDEGPNPAHALVGGIRRPEMQRLLQKHPVVAFGFLKAFPGARRFFTRWLVM